MIYIFWTVRDKEEAKKIILALLEQKLIACASILGKVESLYVWEGKIEEAEEVKVILKTVDEHFDLICAHIIKHGSYQVPEIVAIEAHKGNPSYLSWIAKET